MIKPAFIYSLGLAIGLAISSLIVAHGMRSAHSGVDAFTALYTAN